jgi:DNA-binding NarL/FixJ family response regulator
MTATRVLVADDHAMFRQGLISMLGEADDLEVVGEASRGDEALDMIRKLAPQIAILDVTMPGLTGIEVARALSAEDSPTRVILLTMHDDATRPRKAIDAGASGYILKSAVFDELMKAITTAIEGGVFITPTLTAKVLKGESRPDLTDRELQVLALIVDGRKSRDIAEELGIAPRTVETHRTNMMQKLGVSNVAALVRYAVKHGLDGS